MVQLGAQDALDWLLRAAPRVVVTIDAHVFRLALQRRDANLLRALLCAAASPSALPAARCAASDVIPHIVAEGHGAAVVAALPSAAKKSSAASMHVEVALLPPARTSDAANRAGDKAWRKQAAADFAGRGGDDGDLVVDEAPPPA